MMDAVRVTIHVSQTIMLYTLKLYNDVCQLHLNKTEKKKLLIMEKNISACYHHTSLSNLSSKEEKKRLP